MEDWKQKLEEIKQLRKMKIISEADFEVLRTDLMEAAKAAESSGEDINTAPEKDAEESAS